jgi:hypothetical protein
MDELTFDPPIRLNRDVSVVLPPQIATRPEASAVIAMLPPCGIHWCGVVACLETSTDMTKLRLALASALDRHGFLSDDDVDARRSIVPEENSMVSRWPSMREMQAKRAQAGEEKAMANREQKNNREKLKPKKDKSKDVPAASSSYKEQFGKSMGKKK